MVDRKTAKAADFDAMSSNQCVVHRIKNGLDRVLRITLGELCKPCGKFFNKVRAGHVLEKSKAKKKTTGAQGNRSFIRLAITN